MSFIYSIACIFLTPFLFLFNFLKCKGRENIPKKGGYILAANHLSAMDMFYIAAFMPKQVRYLAKAELFKNPIMRAIYKSAGAIPIERSAAGTGSFHQARAVLENGEILGIFPQGTRCPGKNPRETSFKHGIGLIAYLSKCDVLPVYIETDKYRTALFRRVTVHFGKPIESSELGFDAGTNAEFSDASELIFNRICDLSGSDTEDKA